MKEVPHCEPLRRVARSGDRPSMSPSSQRCDCGHLLFQDRFAPRSSRPVQVPHPNGQRGVVECAIAEDPGPAGCELPSVGADAAVRSRARHRIPERPAILRFGNSTLGAGIEASQPWHLILAKNSPRSIGLSTSTRSKFTVSSRRLINAGLQTKASVQWPGRI